MERLTWKSLLAEINMDIHIFILTHICYSYGLRIEINRLGIDEYRSKVISRVNDTNIEINKPYSGKSLQLIARFINHRETNWTKKNLLRAYERYLYFCNNLTLTSNIIKKVTQCLSKHYLKPSPTCPSKPPSSPNRSDNSLITP